MSKLAFHSNNRLLPFCIVHLDSGEKVLVIVSMSPFPRVGIYKFRLLGLFFTTLWKFTPKMAGGRQVYIRKFSRAFANADNITRHPLDMVKDYVVACRSSSEILARLNEAERRMVNRFYYSNNHAGA